ncbi:MAG: hypothetical protein RLZZ136_676 [Pseudomonadota bacterium]|jgi:predicted amidohydrolase YtcJ
MLIRNATIWQYGRADLRVEKSGIAAIGSLTPLSDEVVIDAAGGTLLPGLHDHHIHLASSAVRNQSVVCGPPAITSAQELADCLSAPGKGWLRGILYHESVMGLPDARALDAIAPDRPVRIQHRSGRMWLFNSMGLELLLSAALPPPGLEQKQGVYTGRLLDEDTWLQTALRGTPPNLSTISSKLGEYGITGVTEMSPNNDVEQAAWLNAECGEGRLKQNLILAGTLALGTLPTAPHWRMGPAKLHLHENALPDIDETIAFITAAHNQGRPVASHCTTETELVFTLAALNQAGPIQGDRIEHAGIARDEHIAEMRRLGLAVCSQPHFIAERGDRYLVDVEADLHPALYRLRAFCDAGVPLAAGSDAPFGSLNPWRAMAAAVSRQTVAGDEITAAEALTPEQALALFLSDPENLAIQRSVAIGAPADLCLLSQAWPDVRDNLGSVDVAMTVVAGRIIHQSIDQPPIQGFAG